MTYPDPHEATGATELIDSDHALVGEVADQVAGTSDPVTIARRLFTFVRDEIGYEMAPDLASGREAWRASETLARGYGFCQQKAVALAALLRAKGIPSGIVVQDLLDHKIPSHYVAFIGSQRLAVHGLTCAYLEGRWLRLDATLPQALCARKRYRVVEFDGEHDAVLPRTDLDGGPHFDVIEEIGVWPDMPAEIIERTLALDYLHKPEYASMARRHGPGM